MFEGFILGIRRVLPIRYVAMYWFLGTGGPALALIRQQQDDAAALPFLGAVVALLVACDPRRLRQVALQLLPLSFLDFSTAQSAASIVSLAK